ncbi:MAG: PhzF family phenazine biosynthesis protein [Actinobacteria bacterium]|nr:PhzF family phenazine biosynthesis protein [Actinomycetota bacterium]
MRYRIVDVFTDRPLAGNALCVVLDPCPPELMARVAREVNLSETTFVTGIDGDRYEMRIFAPADELRFAGHPSLGTAWALGPGRWTQVAAGGTVTVDADDEGAAMSQPHPTFDAVDAAPAITALGLPGAATAWRGEAAGTAHVYVATDAPIDGLAPDLAGIHAVTTRHDASGLAVFRPLDDTTLHARVFLPAIGIPEDPGTGSAAGPLALLAREVFGTASDITVRQGDEMGRPCRMEVHAEEGAVRVGGRVSACAEGRFTL